MTSIARVEPRRAKFLDHMVDDHVEVDCFAIERQAAVKTPSREVHNVVDQAGHAIHAFADHGYEMGGPLVERCVANHSDAGVDRRQGIAQVVTERGYELFA